MGGSSKVLAIMLMLGPWATSEAAKCRDFKCLGVNMCSEEAQVTGECVAPEECPLKAIQMIDGVVEIRGRRCRVTLEQIRLALPEVLTKEGTEYTLNNKILLSYGAVLEIHGASQASHNETAVSLLKLKSDASSSAPIVARHGKISILDTNITSWDASVSGPDVRVLEDGRAYIAALSAENARSGKVYTSRMDVENSEISHLGNDGDYHSDIDYDYGLVWKVMGYDDRYPEQYDLNIFKRVGVYGSLNNNNLHDNIMGAYCYGMKGNSEWSHNQVHNNTFNGLNPQDNSDGMTIHHNHVHDNGWHGIEYSKRCQGALVYNNTVEDNARAGIFFHRSTDYAEAYGNTCRRNLGGDIGIFESTGCKIHNNIMEGGKYGIRLSLGAENTEVYQNNISNSTSYGVFFYHGSDQAEASLDWEGRPRNNTIRENTISDPFDGRGVGVKESDDNYILDNVFIGIEALRFDNSTNTLVKGNALPGGVKFILAAGATLAFGSQNSTDESTD